MTPVHGSVTLELNTDRLVEAVAQRTAVLVVGMLRAGPAGADYYEREPEPDTGPLPPRGTVRDNLAGEQP